MDDARELRRMAIHREVDERLNEQEKELKEAILQGCREMNSLEEICARMVLNGVVISAKIVADMAINMLIDYGLVLPASDDELRKSLFSVVEKKEDQGGE